jgi:hypothetical protein
MKAVAIIAGAVVGTLLGPLVALLVVGGLELLLRTRFSGETVGWLGVWFGIPAGALGGWLLHRRLTRPRAVRS